MKEIDGKLIRAIQDSRVMVENLLQLDLLTLKRILKRKMTLNSQLRLIYLSLELELKWRTEIAIINKNKNKRIKSKVIVKDRSMKQVVLLI
jgi:hypothetical protein